MGELDLQAELLRLEVALATRDPDGIEGGLASLIADDFLEFGRSGRIWTRDSILELLTTGPSSAPVPMDRFEATELAEGVALVTYHGAIANRCSVWVRRDGRWQMRFHQGTPTGDGGH